MHDLRPFTRDELAAMILSRDDLRELSLNEVLGALLALRTQDVIENEAFHQLEEELDFEELAVATRPR